MKILFTYIDGVDFDKRIKVFINRNVVRCIFSVKEEFHPLSSTEPTLDSLNKQRRDETIITRSSPPGHVPFFTVTVCPT